jgi:hypothetical protein
VHWQGKARKSYELGVKVDIVVTARKERVVGARSFLGFPHDGDTVANNWNSLESSAAAADDGDRGSRIPWPGARRRQRAAPGQIQDIDATAFGVG